MPTTLSPADRERLSGIVVQMHNAGETDDYIQKTVDLFKQKYGAPEQSPAEKVAASRQKLIEANEGYKKNPPTMEHPNLGDEFIRGAAGYGLESSPVAAVQLANAYMRRGPGQVAEGLSDLPEHPIRGGNKILAGGAITALPFAPAAAVAAPAAFAAGVPLSLAGGAAGAGTAKFLGADPETQQFAGGLGALAAGTYGPRYLGPPVGRGMAAIGEYLPRTRGFIPRLGRQALIDAGNYIQSGTAGPPPAAPPTPPPVAPPPAATTTGTAFPMAAPRPIPPPAMPPGAPGPLPGPVAPAASPAAVAPPGWSVPPSVGTTGPALTAEAIASIPEAIPVEHFVRLLQQLPEAARPIAMKLRAQFVAEHPELTGRSVRGVQDAATRARVEAQLASNAANPPEPVARPVAPPPAAVEAAPAAADAAPVVAEAAPRQATTTVADGQGNTVKLTHDVPPKVAASMPPPQKGALEFPEQTKTRSGWTKDIEPATDVPPTPAGDLPPVSDPNWNQNSGRALYELRIVQRFRQKLASPLTKPEEARGLSLMRAGKPPNEAMAILRAERDAKIGTAADTGTVEATPVEAAPPAKAEPAKAEPAKAEPTKAAAGVRLTENEARDLAQAGLKSDAMDMYHDLRMKGVDHDAALAQTKLAQRWQNDMGQGTLVDMANRLGERARTGDWPTAK